MTVSSLRGSTSAFLRTINPRALSVAGQRPIDPGSRQVVPDPVTDPKEGMSMEAVWDRRCFSLACFFF